MKDTIYLTANKNKIQNMGKRKVPKMTAGERAFKVTVEIPDDVFKPKTMTIRFETPYTDFNPEEDVNMENQVITEDEKEKIIQERINKIKDKIEQYGYTIKEKEDDNNST